MLLLILLLLSIGSQYATCQVHIGDVYIPVTVAPPHFEELASDHTDTIYDDDVTVKDVDEGVVRSNEEIRAYYEKDKLEKWSVNRKLPPVYYSMWKMIKPPTVYSTNSQVTSSGQEVTSSNPEVPALDQESFQPPQATQFLRGTGIPLMTSRRPIIRPIGNEPEITMSLEQIKGADPPDAFVEGRAEVYTLSPLPLLSRNDIPPNDITPPSLSNDVISFGESPAQTPPMVSTLPRPKESPSPLPLSPLPLPSSSSSLPLPSPSSSLALPSPSSSLALPSPSSSLPLPSPSSSLPPPSLPSLSDPITLPQMRKDVHRLMREVEILKELVHKLLRHASRTEKRKSKRSSRKLSIPSTAFRGEKLEAVQSFDSSSTDHFLHSWKTKPSVVINKIKVANDNKF